MLNKIESCAACDEVIQIISFIFTLSIEQIEPPILTTVWLLKPFPNIVTFVPPWMLPLVGDIESITASPVIWIFDASEFPFALKK